MSNFPSIPTTETPQKCKGHSLSRIDNELKMLHSGQHGPDRLIHNIAFDFMEKHPGMPWDAALFAARAYCDRTYGN